MEKVRVQHSVEDAREFGLPVVVVDDDTIERSKARRSCLEELAQFARDRAFGVLALAQRDRMAMYWCLPDEGVHPRERRLASLDGHKAGKAKPYQVNQILKAIDRLKEEN